MKIVDNFIFFWGGWLSNFHPCRIVFGSKVFKSSEQLFMYLKDPALNGKFFVEASPFDRVWGIGYDQDHALQNQSNWGENLLGKTLTFYRGSL